MADKSLSEMESLVGESVTTSRNVTVEAGKVAEFANALRDHRPLFRSSDVATAAGYDTTPAPLTFTRISYFPRYRPVGVGRGLGFDLGFAPERVVHGEQAYQFDRPLYVGETLTGITTLRDVFQRDGSNGGTMTFAVLETEFETREGERVLTATNTRIETGEGTGQQEESRTDGGRPRKSASPESGRRTRNDDGPRLPDSHIDDTDLLSDGGRSSNHGSYEPGDSGPELVVPDLQRKDFVKYAGASGDFNRIHYDEPYAHAAGYDSVIGQGMLTAGYVSRMITDWFGLAAIRQFSTRFQAQVRPGDTLTVSGTVTDVSGGSCPTTEAELAVTNQTGATVLTGTVTASNEA